MPIYKSVVRSTSKVSPNTPNSVVNNPMIELKNVNYQMGVKTLTFTGTVKSHNRFGTYNVIVTFKNVGPRDGLSDEEIMQGFKPKAKLGRNDIMARCGCPNYRFRFDKANRSHGVGTGSRFGFYHRKTDRKPNNPLENMGFCAHIMEFVNFLKKQGFIL